jgi:hypothetical protein
VVADPHYRRDFIRQTIEGTPLREKGDGSRSAQHKDRGTARRLRLSRCIALADRERHGLSTDLEGTDRAGSRPHQKGGNVPRLQRARRGGQRTPHRVFCSGYDLQQRLGSNRELSNKRPIVSED